MEFCFIIILYTYMYVYFILNYDTCNSCLWYHGRCGHCLWIQPHNENYSSNKLYWEPGENLTQSITVWGSFQFNANELCIALFFLCLTTIAHSLNCSIPSTNCRTYWDKKLQQLDSRRFSHLLWWVIWLPSIGNTVVTNIA